MDLHAAQSTGERRRSPTTFATMFCFALACALMIGSLIAPDKQQRTGQPAAPLTWHSATWNS